MSHLAHSSIDPSSALVDKEPDDDISDIISDNDINDDNDNDDNISISSGKDDIINNVNISSPTGPASNEINSNTPILNSGLCPDSINPKKKNKVYSVIEGFDYFNEPINYVKYKHIIDNFSDYRDTIVKKARESSRFEKKDNTPKTILYNLQKTYNLLEQDDTQKGTEYSTLRVKYAKGTDSNNLGREYCIGSVGIQSMINIIRQTVCDNWVDIDMVNSHPNILKLIFDMNGLESPMLNDNITNRDEFLKKVNPNLSKAKNTIIKILNGDKYTNNEFILKFKNELTPLLKKVCKLPQYKYIYNDIKKLAIIDKAKHQADKANKALKDAQVANITPTESDSEPDNYYYNIIGKSISKIIQVIENDLLTAYIEWSKIKGFLENRNISLIFDGFQLLKKYNITDALILECEQYALKKTGFLVPLKIKPFDSPLKIPKDYNNSIYGDNIEGFTNIIKNNIDNAFYKHNYNLIVECVNNKGHTDIAELISKTVKGRLYYDEKNKLWYHCNPMNIWSDSECPSVLENIITVIGSIIFNYHIDNLKYLRARLDPKDPDTVEALLRYDSYIDNTNKILKGLKMVPFRKHITAVRTPYIVKDFHKNFDSKPYLLAFNDKVFDFNYKPKKDFNKLVIEDFIRGIEPNDYICKTTKYNFPDIETENVDTINKLNTYFNEILPTIHKTIKDDDDNDINIIENEGLLEYVLNIFATTLNGANKEQSIFIHTGNGKNGKTQMMSMLEITLGDYYVSVSAETFTEKEKANGNNQMYLFRNARLGTYNEPDAQCGTYLQVSTLKKFGDTSASKLKGKMLYKQETEFINQTTLHGCMNNKPTLSDNDDGIGRRIKIINYLSEFVDEDDYNTNNIYHKIKNPSIINFLVADDTKFNFIRMLLKIWIKNVMLNDQVKVPECVKIASAEYCEDNNIVKKFVDECLTITNNIKDRERSSTVYGMYKTYMKDNSSDIPYNIKKFIEQMRLIKGIEYKSISKINYCCNILNKKELEREEKKKADDKERNEAFEKNNIAKKYPIVDTFHDDTDDEVEVDMELLRENEKKGGVNIDSDDNDPPIIKPAIKRNNNYCITRTQDKSF